MLTTIHIPVLEHPVDLSVPPGAPTATLPTDPFTSHVPTRGPASSTFGAPASPGAMTKATRTTALPTDRVL